MSSPVNRRQFVAGAMPLGIAGGAVGLTPAAGRAATTATALGESGALPEQDAGALAAALAAGRTTSVAITRACLQRIAALDRRGPMLRSVIELNPDALAQARAADAERKAVGQAAPRQQRSPLHGLPVLLKDNIATADRMATTAGSLALAGLHARRDAHIVQRLRDAGAVILGKTNLSEWANIRSTRSTSGWSSRGGQTRNPHVLHRNTSGSSSGAGAAIAAGLAPLAVGTETDGSITSPATTCGIVGFKPTVGLVSRDGIIPIAASQDTAGPMTRTVRDAALLLQVLAGRDARDAATDALPPALLETGFTAALQDDALQGARIGVIRASVPPQPAIARLFDEALRVLQARGAVLVDKLAIANQDKYGDTELTALLCELKDGLPAYLRDFQPDAPFKDLAGLIAWNRQHAARVMPFFDQELFEQAQATQGTAGQAFQDALATNRRFARTEGLDALFAEHRLDAVVAPTGNLAWPIDPLLGDHFTAGGFMSPFAVAGYPHLSVPMGFVHGLPVGLSIGGLAWQDARVLALGHAYEQASRARRAPRFLREVVLPEPGAA